jgi:hypothetical protein
MESRLTQADDVIGTRQAAVFLIAPVGDVSLAGGATQASAASMRIVTLRGKLVLPSFKR